MHCSMSSDVGIFYAVKVSLFDLQIENHKLYFREQAQPKCGSLDYFNHIPGGGDKKVVYLMNCIVRLLKYRIRLEIFISCLRVSNICTVQSLITGEVYVSFVYLAKAEEKSIE